MYVLNNVCNRKGGWPIESDTIFLCSYLYDESHEVYTMQPTLLQCPHVDNVPRCRPMTKLRFGHVSNKLTNSSLTFKLGAKQRETK